jgi:hypothetical protein
MYLYQYVGSGRCYSKYYLLEPCGEAESVFVYYPNILIKRSPETVELELME